ncbi:MAG: class I SAM-dependent methyltransferase [Candidatus Tectomicrobia bacterium]|nr:class I SAM-dependent methyltransferase [Candidatus Tectomicrobia bacterium]
MRSLDFSAVKYRKAFLGPLTRRVRERARLFCQGSRGRVLDIGCGNALFFASLHTEERRGRTLVGLDYSEELLQEARAVLFVNRVTETNLVRGDAFLLPFREKMFERVFVLNVLLNLPDQENIEQLLREAMRVCADMGKVIVEIRNRNNLLVNFRYWLSSKRSPLPVKGYRVEDLQSFFARHHFAMTRVVAVRYIWLPFSYLLEAERISER